MSSYTKSGAEIRQSFTQMWEILMNIMQDETAGEIICILDALDECEDKEGSGRCMLIDALRKFHSDHIESKTSKGTCLKILVTSRPYTDIERRFKVLTKQFPTVHVSGDEESVKISKEIDIVIEDRVKHLGNELDLDEKTTYALREKLSNMEHRTYLWLRLIFEVLRQQLKTTERHLLNAIEELPQTVDQAYEAILMRIPKSEVGRARKLLSIVLVAKRPLLVQEMNIALAVDEEGTQNTPQDSVSSLDLEPEAVFRTSLTNICGLFVTVVDSKIYLIHQTARPFLLSNSETRTDAMGESALRWKNSIHLPQAHLLLTKICVNYLLFRDFEQETLFLRYGSVQWQSFCRESSLSKKTAMCIPNANPGHLMATYASKTWAIHVQQITLEEGSPLFENIWKLCDIHSHYTKVWILINCDYYDTIDSKTSSQLEVSAWLDLDFLARRALQHRDLPDAQCEKALRGAIRNGNDKIVRLFLEERKCNHLVEYLTLAAQYNRSDILKILVEHGAPINGFSDGRSTPLFYAVDAWSRDAVKTLLELGADADLCGGRDGCRPLCKALYKAKVHEPSKLLYYMRETDFFIKMLLAAGAETGCLEHPDEMESLSKYHEREKKREEQGKSIEIDLDLEKLAKFKADQGSS